MRQTLAVPYTTPKRILIVEDQGLIAMDLKRRLEYSGYLVTSVAKTADDAVRLAKEQNPDVILMDIQLSRQKDGIEAATEIRQSLDIPVVFVTAHADSFTLERAMRAEPFGYIAKPFGATDLRPHIEMAFYKHQSERKLKASEALFAATLRTIGEAVVATGHEGQVSFMNPMAARLSGWDPDSARGRPVADIFPFYDPNSGDLVTHPVFAMLDQKGTDSSSGEYLLRSRSGGRHLVHAEITANQTEGRIEGAVMAFRDITREREIERRDQQRQNLTSISVMAGSLAHDFNNLLTVILGYTDLALASPSQIPTALVEIQRAGQSAAALCRQLLTISRNDVVHAETLDLNEVIRDNSKMLQQVLGPICSLVVTPCRNPLYVRADRTELQQVLINLAINSSHAMRHGGTLTISTAADEPGKVQMTVRDTGIGMSPATKQRVFEPFFSSKGSKGTGLGMTIVHSIITKWSGTIDVESEPGRGTSFVIHLPEMEKPATERISAPAGPTAEAPPGGAARSVLLVEDDSDVRKLLAAAFEPAGLRIIEAASGEDALRTLMDRSEPLDLLITDVMMPRMTGAELARQCVDRWPETRVLFISGYSQDELAGNRLLASGQAEFMPKPVSPAALVARAREIMARSRSSCA